MRYFTYKKDEYDIIIRLRSDKKVDWSSVEWLLVEGTSSWRDYDEETEEEFIENVKHDVREIDKREFQKMLIREKLKNVC